MSTLFVRTLRDDPNDAEVPSHRLLVRAGYIRRNAPGIYTWLPLGLRVLRKIEDIIREEMDDIGAQELSFPALLPREPYEATNRWTEYGHNIFRLQDRKGGDYLLGPTHEEMFTLVVKDLYSSYKDLPLSIYQIQTKYRDEARPRAGLLRGREFVMKDSYSFDVDDAGLDAVLPAAPRRLHPDLRPARLRVRHRQGDVRRDGRLGSPRSSSPRPRSARTPTSAAPSATTPPTSRPSPSRAPAPVRVRRRARRARRGHPRHPHHRHAGRPPQRRLTRATTAPGWPATRSRTSSSCSSTPTAPASPSPSACPATARSTRSASRASSSPSRSRPIGRGGASPSTPPGQGLHRPRRAGREAVRDPLPRRPPHRRGHPLGDRRRRRRLATSIDLVVGRDFTPDGTIEAAEVRDGDACPDCDEGILESARGIEMGHIFQLGRKYADALGLQVLDENGKLVTVTMGSYGIGPSRAVAAIAEGTLDDDRPVLAAQRRAGRRARRRRRQGRRDLRRRRAARRRPRRRQGIEVLYDDRRGKVSPGVKFKDAELIGVPTIVTVGRGLADGTIEVRDRRTDEREEVAVGDAAARIVQAVRGRCWPDRFAHMAGTRIEAVIFDWGGTLTRWHDVDFHAESVALAQAVRTTPSPDDDHHAHAERLHRAGDVDLGAQPRPPAELDDRRPLRRGGPRPRPRPAAGLLRVLGAAHAHRPRGPADVGGAAVDGRQGRRAVQHDLAARVARRLLRARRRLRPGRRRRLLQRDPVDQAVAARLRCRDGGRRRRATRPRASTWGTGSSTTSGAPTTPACGRSTSR